jgi:hypothetical protein
MARPLRMSSTELSTVRTNVNTPSAYTVGSTVRAKMSKASPTFETCAMKPSAISEQQLGPLRCDA